MATTWLGFGRCVAVVALSMSPALAQDGGAREGGAKEALSEGQVLFNNACRTCHTTKEGDNRLGPSLYRIVGRKAGSLPKYGYSASMEKADLVWDPATLDRFIANPDAVVSGNAMKPYGGLPSPEERAKIIAFLQAPSGN